MDRDDLARWTRFAMKGGIGKCVAICDCIAENSDDLMFLKDDEITVLLQVQDTEGTFLGYCEGVIGRFQSKHVSFLTKLKKPVMAKRSSIASLKSKSPTPPGTSNGPTTTTGSLRFKTPTPTFGLATTPTSETPPIPGSSSASVRTDSRASVSVWKSPPHSPVATSFTFGGGGSSSGGGSNRSSGTTGWRVDGERRVSGGTSMRAALHQSNLSEASSRRMDSISSSYSTSSELAMTPSSAGFSTATSVTSIASSLSFSSFAPPAPVSSPPPAPAVDARPPSVTPPPVSLPPPPRHSLISPSSSIPSIPNPTPNSIPQDTQPLLPPPTIKPSSSWARASMLERQFDLVQNELREGGWEDSTDEGHGVGSASGSVSGSVIGSPEGRSIRGGGSEGGSAFSSPNSDQSRRPRPLDLSLELPTSPLRISKKSPMSISSRIPSSGSSHFNSSQDGTDDLPSTSISILDSESYPSTIQRRLSSSTTTSTPDEDHEDGEVGIGLSLLQNLLGGGSDSDSDSDEGGEGEGDEGSVYSVEYAGDGSAPPRSAFSGGFADGTANVNGGEEGEEDEDGTVEGLVYGSASEDDEDDDEDEGTKLKEKAKSPSANDFPMPPTSPTGSVGVLTKSISMASLVSRREKDKEREKEKEEWGQMTETPTTPTSPTPTSFTKSPGGGGLSPPISPRSPSFAFSTTSFLASSPPPPQQQYYPFPPPSSSHSTSSSSQPSDRERSSSHPSDRDRDRDRERRKSLAPSVTSQGSSASTWDGGDIYDNYRYSRMSMGSKVSVGSRERRGSQGTVASYTAGSSGVGVGGGGVGGGGGGDGEDVPPVPDVRARVGSDVSVYSIIGGGEGRVRAGSTLSLSSTSAKSSPGSKRPTPLDFDSPLSQSQSFSQESTTSPLLHATWGSPVSSPGHSTSTYPPLSLDSSLPTPRGGPHGNSGNSGSSSIGNLAMLKTPVTASTMIEVKGVGMVGMGNGGLVGMASAMRRRVEAASPPSPGPTFGEVLLKGSVAETKGESGGQGGEGGGGGGEVDDSIVSGLGTGIVVEDEEELPSRILEEDEGRDMVDSPDGERTVEGIIVEEEEEGTTKVDDQILKAGAPSLPPTTISISSPTPPPPSTTPDSTLAQYASHLRPSLRDLREGGMVRVEGTGERRSLFMPHPNAPKAPPVGLGNEGPMYVRQQLGPGTGAPPPPMPYAGPGPGPGPSAGYYTAYQAVPPPPRAPFGYVLGQVRAAMHAQAHGHPPPPLPLHGGARPQQGQRRVQTIYGRLEVDLASSMGPVPVVWSLEPPPTKVMNRQPSSQQMQMQVQGNVGGPPSGPHHTTNVATSTTIAPSPLANSNINNNSNAAGTSVGGRGSPGPGPGPGPVVKRPSVVSLREGGSPLVNGSAGTGTTESTGAGGGAKPIPRPNFFPKAAGSRPRSRSFSDLKSAAGGQSSSLRSSLSGEIKKSSSITGSTISSSSSTPPNASSKLAKSSPLRPSPLSLSVTNPSSSLKTLNVPMPLRSPTSPLAQTTSFPPPASPSTAPSPVPPSPSVSSILSVTTNGGASNTLPPGAGLHLRKLASSSTSSSSASRQSSTSINETGTNLTTPVSSTRDSSSSSTLGVGVGVGGRPVPVSRSTLPVSINKSVSMVDLSAGGGGGGGSTSTPSTTASPTVGPGSLPARMGSLSTDEGSGGGGGHQRESASSGSERSQLVTSPIPMVQTPTVVRQSSLRAKLSLPNLRRNRSRQDELPVSPVVDAQQDLLLQVQDMEFELVRPNLNQYFSAARSSEDSSVLGRDGLGLDVGPIPGSSSSSNNNNSATPYLRADSPAISMLSSGARSPTIEGTMSWPAPGPGSSPVIPTRPPPESESQMEAHRNRELKWMSLLSSSPPSQARKTKKVRKLLLDGVPASVRYLVWSHLTDGKARCVPGVYEQLYKRGKVPLTEEIEKNVEQGAWFAREEQSQLRTLAEAGGGVVQLLQAYLNMVPDIQYMPGLPHIVGQLLLLAPEEDAFWIFISIMDTHIRPYFSSGSTQMEVDSALFSRALEVNDAAVAKKLLVDMGISPSSICAPWFSSLYVGCLPPEYLTRTWDLFLYDGIPFLLRVGLAIVSFVRRQLLECTSEEAALRLLHRPPPISLPPSPENYLSFILSIKLKDDDVRKQRIKMEAQVKRQTQQQQPRPSNAGGSISLPRP